MLVKSSSGYLVKLHNRLQSKIESYEAWHIDANGERPPHHTWDTLVSIVHIIRCQLIKDQYEANIEIRADDRRAAGLDNILGKYQYQPIDSIWAVKVRWVIVTASLKARYENWNWVNMKMDQRWEYMEWQIWRWSSGFGAKQPIATATTCRVFGVSDQTLGCIEVQPI